MRKGPAPKLYTHDGVTLDLAGWSQRTGIGRGSLQNRLQLGWSLERVFTRAINKGRDAPKAAAPNADQIFTAWVRMPPPRFPETEPEVRA